MWWRNFHDSQLTTTWTRPCATIAMRSPERINEYQARVYASEGSLFPTLDAGLNAGRTRSQSAATGLPVYGALYKGSLTASYDVDLWGRQSPHRRCRRGDTRSAKSRRSRSGSDGGLLGGFRLRPAGAGRATQGHAIDAEGAEEAFKLAQRQYQTGYSSRLELMQSGLRAALCICYSGKTISAATPPFQDQYRAASGFSAERRGAEIFDAALRTYLETGHGGFKHLAEPILHRPVGGNDGDLPFAQVLQSRRVAIDCFMRAIGVDACAEDGWLPGTFKIRNQVRRHSHQYPCF